MDKEKLKLIYENANIPAYEFDKRLLKDSDNNIFVYDANGTITGFHYLNYAKAAATLLRKIQEERDQND